MITKAELREQIADLTKLTDDYKRIADDHKRQIRVLEVELMDAKEELGATSEEVHYQEMRATIATEAVNHLGAKVSHLTALSQRLLLALQSEQLVHPVSLSDDPTTKELARIADFLGMEARFNFGEDEDGGDE